ncbi:P-loop containing nucleoside triphosphate hydrolase protein [Karstenula rhodostoma CBS 690.94]|uniref:P-loop containing nucleoside triphosphate hydrolase protein n=1 Tax=Karstenula rhodostoma CBS 690.94 TaxID=1392251 RepID=A0A9P4P9I6_9PLEO|nr:P-loop containing nucleoside triphosphate hydrolase protein [Karstenula rhodostoma CBS 690.94]
MELLGSCSREGKTWKGEPRTFLRPFHYILFFHDTMKRKVEEATKGILDDTLIQSENDTSSEEEDNSSSKHVRAKARPRYDFSSEEAQEELRCYIRFVDEQLIPPSRRFDNPDVSKPQTVRFHELDYLFKLGQYVYFERSFNVGKPIATEQRVKRVYEVVSKTPCGCLTYECGHRTVPWMLRCYYLDHDGERYGALASHLNMRFWEGEKKITDLDYYPVEYLPENRETELKRSKSDGANFVSHLTKRYSFYSGWSLIKGPDLRPIDDPKTSEPMKNPEHVESDVLVDLTETFDSIPSWRPTFDYVGPRPPLDNVQYDKWDTLSIISWSDKNRATVKSSWQDVIHDDLWVNEDEVREFIGRNPALCLTGYMLPPAPSGDELALLPRRMFAYAVWDRKFLPIDSRYLKRSERHGEEGEAFEQLQILDDSKRLISALLQSHFRKKELESQGIEVPTQDLIRGKGRGIVILLHGVPGVGKTATAEAVAQKWRRPLFPITCGDLGFTPEKVEASLKEIFRLAHRWDCVLLLDEADVFIAQREKTGADLQRNALVSVFLRMLEYYNGVLFLTTNRVGVLDEAIKSRVHLHLKYNHLNKDQTVKIFEHNIKRLRVIEQQRSDDSRLTIAENEILDFARKHYDQHSNGTGIGMWNGRQIRNAFLIAASLAHHDGDLERESDPAMQKQLRASHFDLVDKATVSYDQDRAETLGHTDSELAYDRMERNDPRNRQTGHNAPRSHVQPPHYAGGQYTSPPGGFHGTSQSAYPLQGHEQVYSAGSQSYGGPMSEPRFSTTANEPRNDTLFMNVGQQGYAPSNAQSSDTRGGAAPWQSQNDGQWR